MVIFFVGLCGNLVICSKGLVFSHQWFLSMTRCEIDNRLCLDDKRRKWCTKMLWQTIWKTNKQNKWRNAYWKEKCWSVQTTYHTNYKIVDICCGIRSNMGFSTFANLWYVNPAVKLLGKKHISIDEKEKSRENKMKLRKLKYISSFQSWYYDFWYIMNLYKRVIKHILIHDPYFLLVFMRMWTLSFSLYLLCFYSYN